MQKRYKLVHKNSSEYWNWKLSAVKLGIFYCGVQEFDSDGIWCLGVFEKDFMD